ncbi:MAG TPA: glycoside hydrolase family 32 protein [Acidobacteriaceae bacterium]|nr:glycoside hydrolase family 32 protein [Acidobacteriaceae bacterium]
MNRRELLKAGVVLAGASGVANVRGMVWADAGAHNALEARLARDPRRPQFHLLPKRNWTNDPNGPVYWKGQYHMFFQYNPDGAYWGDMHWGHAVSPDLVHWRHLPVALAPTPGGPDAQGCFSGTAVIDGGEVAVLYTGVVSAPENDATLRDGVHSFRETQCLATSDDPELKVWRKRAQPVIAAPPVGMRETGFRDPSPWRQGDVWYMTVGSGVPHEGGAVLLYRSKDLRQWEYLHPVASGAGSGKDAANPVDTGDMWECPELFPLGGKHVLIYSAKGKVHWQTGVLDDGTMRFHAERYGELDYGTYYAAKTQLDLAGNRIVWGWINETRPLAEYKASGWAGLMSLPRVLTLRADGTLGIEVLSAVRRLREGEKRLVPGADVAAECRRLAVRSATGEMLARLARGREPFKVELVGRLTTGEMAEPVVTVGYDPVDGDAVKVDGVRVPAAGGDGIEAHIYIDGSVAELIVQGSAAYTKRFYYAGNEAPAMGLRVHGPKGTLRDLRVWQVKPISADRLTT